MDISCHLEVRTWQAAVFASNELCHHLENHPKPTYQPRWKTTNLMKMLVDILLDFSWECSPWLQIIFVPHNILHIADQRHMQDTCSMIRTKISRMKFFLIWMYARGIQAFGTLATVDFHGQVRGDDTTWVSEFCLCSYSWYCTACYPKSQQSGSSPKWLLSYFTCHSHSFGFCLCLSSKNSN